VFWRPCHCPKQLLNPIRREHGCKIFQRTKQSSPLIEAPPRLLSLMTAMVNFGLLGTSAESSWVVYAEGFYQMLTTIVFPGSLYIYIYHKSNLFGIIMRKLLDSIFVSR
jgi:hypothetical protein